MSAYNEFVGNALVSAMDNAQLAKAILQCEQPMTLNYLCKRICALRDMPRITPSMQAKVIDIVKSKLFFEKIGSTIVVWNNVEASRNFSGYRQNNGRDITEMPPIEIANAIMETISEQVSISKDALTFIVAKKLGFTRRGAKVDQALNETVDYLIAKGKIFNIDGKMRLANS